MLARDDRASGSTVCETNRKANPRSVASESTFGIIVLVNYIDYA